MSGVEPPDPVSDWLCPRTRREIGPPAPSWPAWLRNFAVRIAPLSHSVRIRFLDIVCLVVRIAEKVAAPPPASPALYLSPPFDGQHDPLRNGFSPSTATVSNGTGGVTVAAFAELREVLMFIREHVSRMLALLPQDCVAVSDDGSDSCIYVSDIHDYQPSVPNDPGEEPPNIHDLPPLDDIFPELPSFSEDAMNIGIIAKGLQNFDLVDDAHEVTENTAQYMVLPDDVEDDGDDEYVPILVETLESKNDDAASVSTDSSSIAIDDAASVESAEISPLGGIERLRDKAFRGSSPHRPKVNIGVNVERYALSDALQLDALQLDAMHPEEHLEATSSLHRSECKDDSSQDLWSSHDDVDSRSSDLTLKNMDLALRRTCEGYQHGQLTTDNGSKHVSDKRAFFAFNEPGSSNRLRNTDNSLKVLDQDLQAALASDGFLRVESDILVSQSEIDLHTVREIGQDSLTGADDSQIYPRVGQPSDDISIPQQGEIALSADRTGTAIAAKPPLALERAISTRYGTHSSGLSRRLSVVHQSVNQGTGMNRNGSSKVNNLSASSSFDRLITSEHFTRTASVGFIARNESNKSVHNQQPQSPATSVNPAAALRVTFISVNSYGNTELSYDGNDDQAIPHGVGLLGTAFGPSPSFNNRPSFRSSLSHTQRAGYAARGSPSPVEEAAGSLYRSGSIDERWCFVHPIGVGAFSEVWLGEGRKGGGRVAIKIIRKGAQDLFGKGGVCREVLAFQTIGKHPNIVECIEVCEDELYVYIVLELLTGGLLLPRIADAEQYYPRYDEKDAAHVVRCMIKALSYCHAVGVAHRDVKPENVLFVCEGMDNNIKLTDFGIAHFCDTPCTEKSGTPLYVAPEVLLHKPYGCAADMWSVGVIAHIILCGYPPFDDDDLVQLIRKVKYKPVRLRDAEWRVTSDLAKDFVGRLLVREPEARMTAAEALEHPWMKKTENERPPWAQKWPVLKAAQLNIQDFVVNREFKRVVQHENAESARNLAVLVSMSEKNLGGDDDDKSDIYATSSEDARSASTHVGRDSVSSAVEDDLQDRSFVTAEYKVSKQRRYRGENNSAIPVSEMKNAVRNAAEEYDEYSDTESREQAELRRRRILLQESLRRKGTQNQQQPGADEDRTTAVETSPVSRPSTSAYATSSRTSPRDTSPDLSAYASSLSGSYEERRFADADEDWKRLRGRAEKDMKKLNGRHERQRKLRLIRRPPLFGGSSQVKSKADAKNAMLLS